LKKLLLVILFAVSLAPAYADHLKGGFFTYEYVGPGTNNSSNLAYRVKLTVYMDCSSENNPGQLTDPINITIFNTGTTTMVKNVSASISQKFQLRKTKDDECITGNQTGCYYFIVIYDAGIIELPPRPAGYTLSYQRCCRIIDIQNMPASPASSTFGNTYSISIPGTGTPFRADTNSSPKFLVNDTAVVCGNSFFEIPFIATDPNGDSLSYYFCDAWSGGGQASGSGPTSSTPDPAAPPPYNVIPYRNGFNGSAPLGSGVSINPRTGLISGIAPGAFGEYVVTVCVSEFRQGTLIANSRKELHLKVGQCAPIQATLDPSYITCDGFTLTFSNKTNNGVQTYFWDFGVTTQTNDTANIAKPTFTYSDTGTYKLKLIVNRGQSCADSTTALAKVYPGFFPGFTSSGICLNKPTSFFDTTLSLYGGVDGWRWNFGDASTTTDTSTLKNPSYTYSQTGKKTIQLIVSSSKGCLDTVFRDITIIDKPPLNIIPQDTLICNGDNVQLQAVGNGIFSWTPATNISSTTVANPVVNPTSTTDYIVELNDNGCINKDTSRVRVVNFVTLAAVPDTVICAGDSVRLSAFTDGLRFSWSPAGGIRNPGALTTFALPTANTTYQLTATIGGCSTVDDFSVSLVPYPGANAGPDTTICFDAAAQLHAAIVGNAFSWSPVASLNNPNILDPVAKPKGTTSYVLTVTDNIGCPKPKRDTVVVKVLPKINPSAGKDTSVVVGQPLQFNATGGTSYEWSPSFGLNRTNVNDPIGLYDGSVDSVIYKVVVTNQNGCADSAYIKVKIYDTRPQVFVPSAFTPNGDGLNDYFRPIAVGITRIEYFRVFNRWGQMVFSTTINEQGWDGKIGGKDQPSGTFVWLVKGVDFTGKVVFAKGTVTLIR
jgi:gliding motility-associated-like protein